MAIRNLDKRKKTLLKVISRALLIEGDEQLASNYCCGCLLLGGSFVLIFFLEFGVPADFENLFNDGLGS